jgi:hypothetical protein
MRGTLLKRRQSGKPQIVEGTIVEFRRQDVVAFGKAAFLGRARIMCMVRLADGREVSVKASRQRDQRDSVYLYAVSKPFIEQWVELEGE